jgi:UDP-3-O-[3-hydroxymyristoyl] glucosamine N-acyltransferase
MAALSGIAGSAKVGKNCMIGGQVGVNGHIKIANGTRVGAQAGVLGEIKEENLEIIGTPAINYRQFFRSSVIFNKLPELKDRVDTLEKEVESLKKL